MLRLLLGACSISISNSSIERVIGRLVLAILVHHRRVLKWGIGVLRGVGEYICVCIVEVDGLGGAAHCLCSKSLL